MKKMKTQEIETYLPIFQGFYNNSYWEFDYEYLNQYINDERQSLGLYSEVNIDIDIDNEQFENDITKKLCDNVKIELSDYINDIKFQRVYSPKYYNFSNDTINVKISPNVHNIQKFIYEHKDSFCQYLKDNYTSCDGFISHYDNNFRAWKIYTNDFTNFNYDKHVLGSILNFIAFNLDITESILYDNIMENISCLDYVKNLDELINYTDNSLFDLFTFNGYTKEIASYYVNCFENDNIPININEKTLSIINQFKLI